MEQQEASSINHRLLNAVREFYSYDIALTSKEEQALIVSRLINEFIQLQRILEHLSLFGSNESILEITTSYLPFAAIPYYLAVLFLSSSSVITGQETSMPDPREQKLEKAKVLFVSFLDLLNNFGGVLDEKQSRILSNFENSHNPTVKELVSNIGQNAIKRRQEKIEQRKSEKELTTRLEMLFDYYQCEKTQLDDEFGNLDEEIVRQIYVDHLRLLAIKSFEQLEMIGLESQLLQNRSQQPPAIQGIKTANPTATDYTSKVERIPGKRPKVSELLTEQGRILQPFVITLNRSEIRSKVMGTGQVLPSMTVEEYLNYELANGKLLKPEEEKPDSETDSEDELKARLWDDWKDENPKGSGNMKANIG